MKYEVLTDYNSISQQRLVKRGEVIEVTDEQLIKDLDAAIKKAGSGFMKKLEAEPNEVTEETKAKRTRKKKVDE